MLELNKNLLINGNKYFSQRKPTGTVTPTTSYQYLTNDRFAQKITGTITTPTVEAANDFAIQKSPWCSKYTGTTALASSISEQQRMEADFGLELIGDYISYLGYVTSSSYQTATVNIGYATTKDNHATQTLLFTKDFTIKTDGTVNELKWDKISSLSNLISTGLYVEIKLSNPLNTSTSSTHRIGGQTLVRGRYSPTETLLASRSLIDELRYCQRYYEKSYELGTIPGTATYIGRRSLMATDYGITAFDFLVQKRGIPTLLCYGVNGSAGYISRYVNDANMSYSQGSDISSTHSGSLSGLVGTSGCALHYTVTSEL